MVAVQNTSKHQMKGGTETKPKLGETKQNNMENIENKAKTLTLGTRNLRRNTEDDKQ